MADNSGGSHTLERILAITTSILLLADCGGRPGDSGSARSAHEVSLTEIAGLEPGVFHHCTGRRLSASKTLSFRHRRSGAIASLGRVAHSAQDVIKRPGDAVLIPGKFAYGRVSKDLEDEDVEVFLDLCQGWVSLGRTRSNDDGRTLLSIPSHLVPGVGVYDLVQVVLGDGSQIRSRLTIAPDRSHIVVFDVDGTLTVDDADLGDELKGEYLGWLASEKRSPRAYPDAALLTQMWATKGYLIVYMTGRPYWLAAITRRWLDATGCAPGHLHTTDRSRDALPTNASVGLYKSTYLRSLIEAGYSVDYVYGNAQSDVYAYAAAGVLPSRTHIIGEHGGEGGTIALYNGYTEHLDWVTEQPHAVQPFIVPSKKR